MGNAASDIHVVVVGSGYGGSAAARYLDGKCKLTLIEPSDAFNHKIATLRGAVVPGWEKRTRIPRDKLLKNGKIVRSEVKRVETGRVILADDTVIYCDFVILAHGSGRANFPCDATDDARDSVPFQEKLKQKQKAIASSKSVLIVGGGPVGVELAGEIAAQHPGKKITIVHSGPHILNNSAKPLLEKARKKVESVLAEMGVELKVGCKVTNLPAVQGGDGFLQDANAKSVSYTLSDGSSISADMVIVCIGATRRNGNLVTAVNAANQVTVQPDLQVTGLPKIFCIGDANDVDETKMAYFAEKQGELAAKNVLLVDAGKATDAYVPMDGNKDYGVMIVPLGPNRGVTSLGGIWFGGFTTSLFKGKDLFSQKTFDSLNAALPPVENRVSCW